MSSVRIGAFHLSPYRYCHSLGGNKIPCSFGGQQCHSGRWRSWTDRCSRMTRGRFSKSLPKHNTKRVEACLAGHGMGDLLDTLKFYPLVLYARRKKKSNDHLNIT